MEESQVVPSRKKRILVVAVDFDGCMGHTLFTKRYIEMMKDYANKSPGERDAAYQQLIQESNPGLIDDILKRGEDYDEIRVIVGSNRQSANKDQHDATKNENGSCFTAIHRLAEVLKNKLGNSKGVVLERYLVFDSFLGVEHGTNFDMGENGVTQARTTLFSEYEMSMDKKNRLAFFQIQKICSEEKDAEVSYVHYDDRNDIVNDTAKVFQSENGENLPPNFVRATACHYELYNSIASIQSLSNLAKNENFQHPDDVIGNKHIDQFMSALNDVAMGAQLLEELSQKHADTIEKARAQLSELEKRRGTLDKKSPEYKEISKSIDNLNSALLELEKPKKLLEGIQNIREQCIKQNGGDLNDVSLTWPQFKTLAQDADTLLKSNIRINNLRAIPVLHEEYSQEIDKDKKEHIEEFGSFERQVEAGHQMDDDTFDAVVKECMKDSFMDDSVKADPYGSFCDEEATLQAIQLIEENIEGETFQDDALKENLARIKNLSSSRISRLMDPVMAAYEKGDLHPQTALAYINLIYRDSDQKPEDRERISELKIRVKDDIAIREAVKLIEETLSHGNFSEDILSRPLEIILRNTQDQMDRLLAPIESGFMSGRVSIETFMKCLDKVYSNPEDKLAALEKLFQKVDSDENTTYAPPKNPVVRFLKGLGGKENYSSERLDHIAQLQQEYLKIVRENKDNEEVKKHLKKSRLPDFEIRHLYIGINHATACRKQLMAEYKDDVTMTMQQLFHLSTESKNPFKAEGVGGFIATRLLNAKGRLASFSLDQISEYMIANPDHASILREVYSKEKDSGFTPKDKRPPPPSISVAQLRESTASAIPSTSKDADASSIPKNKQQPQVPPYKAPQPPVPPYTAPPPPSGKRPEPPSQTPFSTPNRRP